VNFRQTVESKLADIAKHLLPANEYPKHGSSEGGQCELFGLPGVAELLVEKKYRMGDTDWGPRDWEWLGALALRALHPCHLADWELPEIADMLEEKRSAYGPKNLLRHGIVGVTVRVWDKLSRFENLHFKGHPYYDERIEDTLRDIVGYCVAALMLDEGTWADGEEN